MDIKTKTNSTGTPQSLTDIQENTIYLTRMLTFVQENTIEVIKLRHQQEHSEKEIIKTNKIINSLRWLIYILAAIGVVLLIWALREHFPSNFVQAMKCQYNVIPQTP